MRKYAVAVEGKPIQYTWAQSKYKAVCNVRWRLRLPLCVTITAEEVRRKRCT